MKKLAIFAAAALVLAACSNEVPGAADESSNAGFASFSVNLPTVSGTDSRAVTYDQGEPQEYAVANGCVLVFRKAANELASTFVCRSPLAGMNWSAAEAGEVTTTARGTARLDNIELDNNNAQYGAIVILNYNDDFKFPAAGETLAAWSATPQTCEMTLTRDNVKYITMSSAAKYVGNSAPVLLADIDKAQIYQTESQAAASTSPASTAFVQRNLAKVSLSMSYPSTIADGNYAGDQVAITDWGLDITNKTSFGVQVTEGLADSFADIWKGGNALNRFFGNGTKFQRVFWAKDPNYADDITTQDAIRANFNVVSDVNGNPASLYARENTFDIYHQMQGQTTRVVMKADYTPAGFAKGETFFKLGSDIRLWNQAALADEIKNRAAVQQKSADITVELGNVTAAGNHALCEVAIKKGGNLIAEADYDAIAVAMGLGDRQQKNIATYAQGKTYYIARVKHFGDEDTPWKIGDPTYNGDNLKYLGRYGMIRNNWYDVKITKISKPGYPCVPEINPTTADDENDYYISVAVNVLSWAKRVHETVL